MGQTEFPDEEEVKILLIGDKSEIGQALELIRKNCENHVCAWIRREFPGISSHDLTDIWQETLIAIFKAAEEERFDPDPPFSPWIFRIAYYRAVDHCRRTTRDKEALEAVGEALRGTNIGFLWKTMREVERRELLELVQEDVAELPRKQRIVIQAFIDNFPDSRSMEVLRKEVLKLTGREETLASVKRALQEARKKIRTRLQETDNEAESGV